MAGFFNTYNHSVNMNRLYILDAVIRPIRRDIRADPKLKYILLVATVMFGFGIWFRVPNFAGPDEYSRLIQPMKVAGRVAADPTFENMRTAVTDGRTLGATFYLYALVLAPLFFVILFTGQLGEFVSLGGIESRWTLWHEAPAWFWTSAILFGRLVSLGLGLACVYLLYRLGFRLRDRWTARVAAVGLTVTFGFVESAHTINEDLPMVFFLLLTVLFCLRYIESGSQRPFLFACATAGLAVAFKLTGGSAVIAVGMSHLLRSLRTKNWYDSLVRPRLIAFGLVIGLATILLGFPSVIVAGPDELLTRVMHTTGQKTTPSIGIVAGIKFWMLRGYLSAFGLPLFIGTFVGIIVTCRNLFRQTEGFDERAVLAGTPVVVTLIVFSQWQYVRIHHLLPTLPLLLLLATLGIRQLHTKWGSGFQIALAVLFVTSLIYTGTGDIALATDPRDEATDWLQKNAADDKTVEVYENSIADVAAVHGSPVQHYAFPEENATYNDSLVLDEHQYTEWMIGMPQRTPQYIQLTSQELRYVAEGHPDAARYPSRQAYIRGLLNGKYNYTVVAKFGSQQTNRSLGERLLRAGIEPSPENREPVVIILAKQNTTETANSRNVSLVRRGKMVDTRE